MNNGNLTKRKKAEQVKLTCSAFYILELFNFSAIIFPVDFRENCATIATTKRQKNRRVIPLAAIKKLPEPTVL